MRRDLVVVSGLLMFLVQETNGWSGDAGICMVRHPWSKLSAQVTALVTSSVFYPPWQGVLIIKRVKGDVNIQISPVVLHLGQVIVV
jgi:hypothetical protein